MGAIRWMATLIWHVFYPQKFILFFWSLSIPCHNGLAPPIATKQVFRVAPTATLTWVYIGAPIRTPWNGGFLARPNVRKDITKFECETWSTYGYVLLYHSSTSWVPQDPLEWLIGMGMGTRFYLPYRNKPQNQNHTKASQPPPWGLFRCCSGSELSRTDGMPSSSPGTGVYGLRRCPTMSPFTMDSVLLLAPGASSGRRSPDPRRSRVSAPPPCCLRWRGDPAQDRHGRQAPAARAITPQTPTGGTANGAHR